MKKGVNTWIRDKNNVANQSNWTLFWILYMCSKRVKYLLLNYKQCCSYQKYSTCHPFAPKPQSCDKTTKSYINLSKTLIRIWTIDPSILRRSIARWPFWGFWISSIRVISSTIWMLVSERQVNKLRTIT